MAAVEQEALALRPIDGKLIFPLPLPPKVRCGVPKCKGLRGSGPWSGPERHKSALRHINTHVEGGAAGLKEVHLCKCGREFSSLTTGGRHLVSKISPCPGLSEVPLGASINSTVASELSRAEGTAEDTLFSSCDLVVPKVNGRELVMEYPGRPSQCPHGRCPFITRATGTDAMNSMARHLETIHGTKKKEDRTIKLWECSICGFKDTGHRLKVHFPKCKEARVLSAGALSHSRELVLATPTQNPINTLVAGSQFSVNIIPETQLILEENIL